MRALQWCHILKLSDSEWKFLFPGQRLKEFFSLPEAKGIRLLAVTMGKAGSYLATPSSTVRVKAMKVKVADPTGAGDGFMAGILYGLAKIDGGLNGGTAALRKIATFANAVGSLTCTKAGGIPAFPSLREVKANLVRA
jgi:sugar/nucleoside kinase (ribokinase family)